MPYRSDARDAESIRARVDELEGRLEGAALRCRAAAGKLRELDDRLLRERLALDEAVADALDAERRAVRASLAAGGGGSERIGDALRAQGAVAALERAMARRGKRPARSDRPPPNLAAARAALRDARSARATLAAKSGGPLGRARERLAAAVAAHDELADELASARRRLDEVRD